jgi:arylsulfate sulfotransferase
MKISSKRSQSGRSSGAARMLMIAASVLLVTLQSSRATQADDTSIILVSKVAGASPFISHLNFKVSPIANLKSVQFTVQPKPGSVTRPISATYSSGYLSSREYLDSAGNLKVPVFGLYDGFTNSVTLSYVFHDSSSKQSLFSLVTRVFDDPCGYKQGTVVKARTLSTSLSYDFMLLKNACSDFSPALMDTDGALRWVGTARIASTACAFFDNAIYLGAGSQLFRIELDGAVSVIGDYSNIGVRGFHHNIDRGKYGLLVEVDTNTDLESVVLEVNKRGGAVRNRWNMASIISRAMRAAGDDPSAFVRRKDDWFHNNAVTYRASDDSLIVSSRENFVIALDYQSSAIKWILGDTSKAWYQYPSLRQYALSVPTGVAPIGQHAVSITYNDNLLLFDNGLPSFSQTPIGSARKFAAPRKYSLNLNNRTASQIFSYNRGIISQICSSVYEDAPDNYLVDYAVAGGYQSGNAFAEIVGLQATGQRVFEYKYPTIFCGEIFNAFPIHLEQLSFPTATTTFADTAP